MIDLDQFKRYNDTHGHQEGDRALIEAAKAIGSVVRNTDLVARYGGEEFLVLLPEANHKDAMTIAERIRRAIQGKAPVTASMGLRPSRRPATPRPP